MSEQQIILEKRIAKLEEENKKYQEKVAKLEVEVVQQKQVIEEQSGLIKQLEDEANLYADTLGKIYARETVDDLLKKISFDYYGDACRFKGAVLVEEIKKDSQLSFANKRKWRAICRKYNLTEEKMYELVCIKKIANTYAHHNIINLDHKYIQKNFEGYMWE